MPTENLEIPAYPQYCDLLIKQALEPSYLRSTTIEMLTTHLFVYCLAEWSAERSFIGYPRLDGWGTEDNNGSQSSVRLSSTDFLDSAGARATFPFVVETSAQITGFFGTNE